MLCATLWVPDWFCRHQRAFAAHAGARAPATVSSSASTVTRNVRRTSPAEAAVRRSMPSLVGERHPREVVQYGAQCTATRYAPGLRSRMRTEVGSNARIRGCPGPTIIDLG